MILLKNGEKKIFIQVYCVYGVEKTYSNIIIYSVYDIEIRYHETIDAIYWAVQFTVWEKYQIETL